MPISHIDDWEERLARQDAFWYGEIIDRPVVALTLPSRKPGRPDPPEKAWPSLRDRWLDAGYQAELALARVSRTEYLGDALPHVYPRMGPEIFSALFGTEMEFGERTTWSVPNLIDWDHTDHLQVSENSFYWQKLVELTDTLLDAGRNVFYTGTTDWHPGGDALAAFRDPARLAMDMIEHRDDVKALLRRVTDEYVRIFDVFYRKLTEARQAISTWMGIVSTEKWYVPSNDFSCMISKEMFDDVFLPGIIEECRFFDTSIYHLDGPGALQHLDSLLEIDELNALQWVFGAGNGPASRWMHVYKRCQEAGKGLEIPIHLDELDRFIEELRPEGLWISLQGVRDRDDADRALKRITAWR
jgi:hypothetical protein